MENSEFYLEYMPTIDMKTHRCVGAEALIRWKRGEEKIAPEQFIPDIEDSALSGLLTYWIIDQVAHEMGTWLRNNDQVHIGINIPPDVLGRGGLEYAALKSGLYEVVDKIILEVTERGYPDNLGIEALRSNKGRVKVAIDDFGTGDANLLHLSKIDADIIKLDKYFVEQIKPGKAVPKIVLGLIAFAKEMGLEIIAEGVETEMQASVMRDKGVEMAQGWYFSKPLTADLFMTFFDKSMQRL